MIGPVCVCVEPEPQPEAMEKITHTARSIHSFAARLRLGRTTKTRNARARPSLAPIGNSFPNGLLLLAADVDCVVNALMVSVALVLPATLAEVGAIIQLMLGEEVAQVNATVTVLDDGPPRLTGTVSDFPAGTVKFLPVA